MEDLSQDIDAVKRWAAGKKLSADTAEAIVSAGFTSLEAIACLDQDSVKKLKLNLGQTKLLEKALKTTFDEGGHRDGAESLVGSGAGRDNGGHVVPEVATGSETHGDDELVRTILNQLRQGQEQQTQQRNEDRAPNIEELVDDPDKEFLLNGIKNGFDIIDPTATIAPICLDNHRSAQPGSPLFHKAAIQICKEIDEGNYIEVSEKPPIISPLGVIPKPDGGVRIIHDCSRPHGFSVNDYAGEIEKQKFSSVDTAARMVTKNCFMAKVDLKSAYRVVKISKNSQKATGIQWQFPEGIRYFYDSKLPFGSKLAPGIFHRLSQAVVRMMAKRGFPNIVAYIDDFFLCHTDKTGCLRTLNVLVTLLRKLGFFINWQKVVDPTTTLNFLGIEICSTQMQLRLPDDKLRAVKEELSKFRQRKRATKAQLQSLVGKLNWVSSVVYGGRAFLRRLINAMNTLRHKSHKLRFSADTLLDIKWWLAFMPRFNGKSLLLDDIPVSALYTDACSEGAGGLWGDSWFYCNWEIDYPNVAPLHINEKEVVAATLAVQYWAPQLANKRVYIFSDNTVTVACINKCSSRNNRIMH
ncbi:uncharacterized protein LOC117319560, partial [Pecten maximus]|uniref:uncharacterized protein LOC117319560 n=1 Tax=Pecten maximus TaxID=6579 RepID=UPI0014585EE3